jgi:hypothetical protein
MGIEGPNNHRENPEGMVDIESMGHVSRETLSEIYKSLEGEYVLVEHKVATELLKANPNLERDKRKR